jgi:ATP-dependent RNA helicase SUPV3L1/SUV3
MDADLVTAVEGHVFPSVATAQWRNARLDFQSLQGLLRSLAEPPSAPGLKLSEESQDETTLRQLAADETIIRRCRDRANLMRLWEICQTPDFRKTGQDDHTRLIGAMFEHLTQKNRRLPEDWAQGQFANLDRADGDIDMLSARLARVRTLSYVANRGDWLADPEGWRDRARALEDRLSDILHEQLMQRFVDRRTSTLMRSLGSGEGAVLSRIGGDGAVTVEGQFVGSLSGLDFEAARGASALENRALRGAIERSVAPEIARRLGRLTDEGDEAFALAPGGLLLWRGQPTGQIVGGAPFSPRVRLLGELGPAVARERAVRRLERFVADEAARHLSVLKQLNAASAEGRLKGPARGLAYQLVEQSGVLDRRIVAAQIRELDQKERRTLRNLGVRFGAFSVYLPALLTPEARLVGAPFAELAHPGWRPAADALSPLPHPAPSPEALALRGLRAVAGLAAPVETLERLDALGRARLGEVDGFRLTPEVLASLGGTLEQAMHVLRALGFTAAGEADAGESGLWRRRPRSAEASAVRPSAPAVDATDRPAAPANRARRRIRRRGAASGAPRE